MTTVSRAEVARRASAVERLLIAMPGFEDDGGMVSEALYSLFDSATAEDLKRTDREIAYRLCEEHLLPADIAEAERRLRAIGFEPVPGPSNPASWGAAL